MPESLGLYLLVLLLSRSHQKASVECESNAYRPFRILQTHLGCGYCSHRGWLGARDLRPSNGRHMDISDIFTKGLDFNDALDLLLPVAI